MFTPVETAFPGGFIQRVDCGALTQHPQVRFCRVDFSLAAFPPGAFQQYGITQPPQLASAVMKRQAEYLAGRYCCAKLLAAQGAPIQVGYGEDRAPCWPAGFCGALSHCEAQAIALVTRCGEGCPGVDIEIFDGPTMRDAADLITLPAERSPLRNGPLEFEQALLLAFSAKESLYKALYPQVRRFFGFESASILSIDAHAGRFTLALNADLSPQLLKGFSFTGQYQFDGRTMTTLLLA